MTLRNLGIGVLIRAHDYVYPSTSLPCWVMPFRSQAHAFSLYSEINDKKESISKFVYVYAYAYQYAYISWIVNWLLPLVCFTSRSHARRTAQTFLRQKIVSMAMWPPSRLMIHMSRNLWTCRSRHHHQGPVFTRATVVMASCQPHQMSPYRLVHKFTSRVCVIMCNLSLLMGLFGSITVTQVSLSNKHNTNTPTL